jgi:hypothetical protein
MTTTALRAILLMSILAPTSTVAQERDPLEDVTVATLTSRVNVGAITTAQLFVAAGLGHAAASELVTAARFDCLEMEELAHHGPEVMVRAAIAAARLEIATHCPEDAEMAADLAAAEAWAATVDFSLPISPMRERVVWAILANAHNAEQEFRMFGPRAASVRPLRWMLNNLVQPPDMMTALIFTSDDPPGVERLRDAVRRELLAWALGETR